MGTRNSVAAGFSLLLLMHSAGPAAAAAKVGHEAVKLDWSLNYGQAMDAAESQGKLLFIYFFDAGDRGADSPQVAFEQRVLSNPDVRRQLSKYVRLLLPLDATIYVKGRPIKVLEHDAFSDLRSLPGLAIVDYKHKQEPCYRQLVSAFPFDAGHEYGVEQLKVILALPRGTLTQRTLIYAVRIHPERPGSADGQLHPALVACAQQHSQYMADVQVQGHQDWESRFHALESRIPDDLVPTEVAAESWPDQPLVDAAIECVYSWRRSPGHWEAVSGRHPIFGFDMKLGRNRIWYATGVFGRRRGSE